MARCHCSLAAHMLPSSSVFLLVIFSAPPSRLWPLSIINLSTLLKETYFCLKGPPATGCLIHVHPLGFFFDNAMMDHLRMDLKAASHGRKHQHPFFCGRPVYVQVYLHVSCSFLPPFPPSLLPHTPPGFRQTATPVSCLIYQASADKCKHLTEEPPHLRSLCGCSHFLSLSPLQLPHGWFLSADFCMVLIYFHTSAKTISPSLPRHGNRCCYVKSPQTVLC